LRTLCICERWISDHERKWVEKYGFVLVGGETGGDLRARRERDVALSRRATSEDADPNAPRA
jgi:hypothetical protein